VSDDVYLDLLKSMSDEVLLEEVKRTFAHLSAAGLDADADVVDEVVRRWATR
jgi:hypothetical protein